jgi:hypothetical protein
MGYTKMGAVKSALVSKRDPERESTVLPLARGCALRMFLAGGIVLRRTIRSSSQARLAAASFGTAEVHDSSHYHEWNVQRLPQILNPIRQQPVH